MNIGKLNLEISKTPSNLGEANVAAKSAQKLNDGLIQNVATVGDLPTASTNCGRQFFVTGDQELYFSDGTSWNQTLPPENQLWTWGCNPAGQLGINSSTTRVTVPIRESSLGTNWCLLDTSGLAHTIAIKTDGTLWTWGCNACGGLGLNNTNNYSTPTQEACGATNWCTAQLGRSFHSSAIKTDGTLWTWGNNNVGQLGLNNVTCYSTPQQEVCGGTNWCAVAGGTGNILAIKTDGTLWGWGCNQCGQLGLNNVTCYSTPQQEVCGGTNWCMVSNFGLASNAIKTDGTLWSWGFNQQGQLGTNDSINYSTPTQEACGGTNWCNVSIGGGHSLAIKTDGTLWAWGCNPSGELGTNNITYYSTPQQEVCGGTNWCMVSGGQFYTLALKTDGTLWAWGTCLCGKLGTGTTNRSAPTQEICGFTNWTTVSAGWAHGGATRFIQC